MIRRHKHTILKAAIWIAAGLCIAFAAKYGHRNGQAHADEGCIGWAKRHGDQELAAKCKRGAPMVEILDHVSSSVYGRPTEAP